MYRIVGTRTPTPRAYGAVLRARASAPSLRTRWLLIEQQLGDNMLKRLEMGLGIHAQLGRALVLTGACTSFACSATVEPEALGETTEALASQVKAMRLPFNTTRTWKVRQTNGNLTTPPGDHTGLNSNAVDFALASGADSTGQPVFAPVGGKVSYVDAASGTIKIDVSGTCNNAVFSANSDCVRWVPSQMQTISVALNQQVAIGQQVGTVGSRNATYANLHASLSNEQLSTPATYQTIPGEYSDFESSSDSGSTWTCVPHGVPQLNNWLRARSPWDDWHSLGGAIVGSPAAVSGTSTVEIYARGTNNKLWEKYWDGANWSNWYQAIPNDTFDMSSSPSVVVKGAKREIFATKVVGNANVVFRNTWTGSAWSGWTSMGGALVGDPTAVSIDSTETQVFGLGTDRRVYREVVTNGSPGGWFGAQQNDITFVTSAPAVLVNFQGGLGIGFEMYALNSANEAIYSHCTVVPGGCTWSNWSSLGGGFQGKLAAISQSIGSPASIFGRGGDNRLWETRNVGGSGFMNWCDSNFDQGGAFTDSPAAIYRGGQTLTDIFVRRSDGSVWQKSRL
jgi:hypothetical protein